jgi:fructokinase
MKPRMSTPELTCARVVGTGLLALDVLLDEHKIGSRAELGGSAGNVLAILAFLGWSSVPVAKLGADVAGARIRREFEGLRADTRFIKLEQHARTPVVYQWPGDEQRTHRFSFTCPFCGLKRGFAAAEPDDAYCHNVLALVEQSDVFYFDRVTDWSLKLAENYRKRGALVVFEPSVVSVDAHAFQRAISASHILKYADERIDELRLFDCRSVDVVIQTLGSEGLRFKTKANDEGAWRTLPAFAVPRVIDTAGAGDWCTAGLLYSLNRSGASSKLAEATVSRALRFGQALAALNCMHAGARGLAHEGARMRLEQLAKVMEEAEREELFETREWHNFFDFSSRLGRASQSNAKSEQSLKYPSRLCCEPLAV